MDLNSITMTIQHTTSFWDEDISDSDYDRQIRSWDATTEVKLAVSEDESHDDNESGSKADKSGTQSLFNAKTSIDEDGGVFFISSNVTTPFEFAERADLYSPVEEGAGSGT
jgi:hypothetical protein